MLTILLKFLGHHQRILTVLGGRVIASPGANFAKTGRLVEPYGGGIGNTDFQENRLYIDLMRLFQQMIQQAPR